jgi:serine/threonine protein kinase
MIFGWFGDGPKEPKSRPQPRVTPLPQVRRYNSGDIIAGDYRVLHVFEGGLGIVYVVEHRAGDRLVLKTIKAQQSETALRNFRKEAQTWVQLGSHANIVKAFWVDEIAGQLCVAAELIEHDELGRLSLRDYLQFGPLTSTLIASLTAHFCYGFEHAISHGLRAHRDIKPENLLIGASAVLKITDFGISAVAPRTDENKSQHSKLGLWHTDDGAISGTPPYMAPEQILGSPDQDARADIYAFGVVLYEMAYGHLPFIGRSHIEFFHHHRHSTANIPSGPFAGIIKRCLAKAPEHRYPTATALFLDLEYMCKAQRISLPPRPEPVDAVLEELRARAHALGAIGKHDEAIMSARELVRRAPRGASNWTQLGRLLLESGNIDGAEEATSRALALDQTNSAAWNNLGISLNRKSKWHEAAEAFDRALDCDPQNTGAMLNASEPLRKIGRIGEAVIRLRRAIEIAPDKFSVWTNLASLYVAIDDRKNALECFQKARNLAPPKYREEIDDCIKSAENLSAEPAGSALLIAGRTVEAKARFQKDTRDDPENKDAWHNLGLCHLQDQNYSEARECFRQVHRIEATNGYAVCRLIEFAALENDLADAEKWCDVLHALPNGAISAIAFRARALEACGRLQDAKHLLKDAISKHPHEPDIFIAFGDISMKYKQSGLAAQLYERAIAELRLSTYNIDRLREIEGKLSIARQNLSHERQEEPDR